MQALGNDFILLDGRRLRLKKVGQLSKRLCDRRFGIGADQELLLSYSEEADFKMRIFNADGTEVEMCGNGIRCLAKYIWDKKGGRREAGGRRQEVGGSGSCRLAIETLAGIIHPKRSGSLINVDMGEPVLDSKNIPVRIDKKSEDKKSQLPDMIRTLRSKLIINYPLRIKDKNFKITCVSMGNPHAVIVVKDVNSIPLTYYGPLIENHRIFPKRTNVEFIQILNRKNIMMRVWERGAGETMACGTGASAAGVASVLLELTDRKVTIHLQGGKLLIEWSAKNNHVYMTGPAVKVFEGTINIK